MSKNMKKQVKKVIVSESSESEHSSEESDVGTVSDHDSISRSEESENENAERTSSRTSSKLDDSSSTAHSNKNTSFQIPPTDSENDEHEAEVSLLKKKVPQRKRIIVSDESSDEEDKFRHSRYEAESDSEGHMPPIEDNAFSKTTRRSIDGYNKSRATLNASEESSDEGSDSFLVEESDDEVEEEQVNDSIHSSKVSDQDLNETPENLTRDDEVEEEVNASIHSNKISEDLNETPEDVSSIEISNSSIKEEESISSKHESSNVSHQEKSITSDFEISMKSAPLSSTIRSPLKELTNVRRSLISNESFNNSIETKMSSTISKDDSYLRDEAAGGVSVQKIRVSQSTYNAEAAEKSKLESQIATMMKMLEKSHMLPDGGEKLKSRLNVLLNKVDEKKSSLDQMEIDESKSIKHEITKSFNSDFSVKSDINQEVVVIDDDDFKKVDNVKQIHFGTIGMKNFVHQKMMTVEKLQDIQQCIDSRPLESELETPPKYLKVELMKHQLHALKFMMWRETQNPRGGILADDMGLGKTLTAISLVLKATQAAEEREEESESDEEDDQDDEWKARGRRDLHHGGTLVVCPASLIKQWEYEIKERTKRDALTVNAFHGANREYKARRLARFDIVLTTYQLAVNEEKNNGCLYDIKWKRIILDEGHVIRNHKSKQSEAICKLKGKYRWMLTGTPIQNKEFDLYACIKFLRCKPFDEVAYWKRWIEVKGQDSSPRVQALLKAILLRRTKQQLMETGEVQTLPNKVYKQFNVKLNQDERIAYSKFLAFSQSLFANFMAQQQEKNNNFTYDKNHLNRIYRKFAKNVNINREVKAHEILTVLMRLRQICCHPGLVKESLLKHENDEGNELCGDHEDDKEHDEADGGLLKQLENLNINEDGENSKEKFSADSEVFNMNIPSSKINHMVDVLREHVFESDDKAIIVSQWTSYLRIIRAILDSEGITYCELDGTVPVKFRNDIVVNFNKPNSGIKIMLLSLTAGGVGLNLVGANYLFLMDLHWNPQLEQQAQDRIYRFGQKKQVNIFKFVCEDTIEERILNIQQKKLETATNSLTGAKKTAGSKLTVDDLKDLFGMNG